MEFACLQYLDMIKLRLGFGESTEFQSYCRNSTVKLKPKDSPESLLGGFSSLIYEAAPPLRMIVPPKYLLRL